MNYSDIKKIDIANGPGCRVSLFVSGCTHRCKNCFNKETWDFRFGKEFTNDTINEIIDYINPSYIKGLTLLGGDPMEYVNIKGLLPLLRRIKKEYPDKNIWCFTGYLFEELLDKLDDKYYKEILSYIDVLVDGEFKEELKSLNLKFKGSSNQRTILVQESLKEKEIILYKEFN